MKDKIRVLHVFSVMDRGGAESLIMNLYRKIDNNIVEFDFVVHTEKEGAFDKEINQLGGKIFYVPKYKGINHFQYVNAWKELFSMEKFDIIHGHVRSTASIYIPIAKEYNIKTIAHSHSTSNGKSVSSLVKYLFQKRIRKEADYFLAPSDDAAKWLFGNEIVSKKNYSILENSIDVLDYKPNKIVRDVYRKKMEIEDDFVVGHIGSFRKSKNHDFLIDIFNEIVRKKENSKLLLIGDGEEKNEIISKLKDYGLLDKVIMTGIREDVSSLLQAMDVFLFPSIFEGFGIVAIEAQAAGLHTIVSDTIPKEAYLTDLIETAKLTDSAKIWAGKALNYSEINKREDKTIEIINKGYDTEEVVQSLVELYIDVTEKTIVEWR